MELVSSLLMDRLDDAVSETVRSFLSLDQDPSMAEVETWNKKATALLEKWKAGPMSEWVREMSTRSDVIDDLSESRSHAWRSASVSNSVGKDETSFPKRQTGAYIHFSWAMSSCLFRINQPIPERRPKY
jgi:hypothetical protein